MDDFLWWSRNVLNDRLLVLVSLDFSTHVLFFKELLSLDDTVEGEFNQVLNSSEHDEESHHHHGHNPEHHDTEHGLDNFGSGVLQKLKPHFVRVFLEILHLRVEFVIIHVLESSVVMSHQRHSLIEVVEASEIVLELLDGALEVLSLSRLEVGLILTLSGELVRLILRHEHGWEVTSEVGHVVGSVKVVFLVKILVHCRCASIVGNVEAYEHKDTAATSVFSDFTSKLLHILGVSLHLDAVGDTIFSINIFLEERLEESSDPFTLVIAHGTNDELDNGSREESRVFHCD